MRLWICSKTLSNSGKTIWSVDLSRVWSYAVVYPWIQKRMNPTSTMTREAARRLEQVAHVR